MYSLRLLIVKLSVLVTTWCVMSRIKTLVAILVSFLFCSQLAIAEQFHVAKDQPGASDSNDGLSPVFVSGNRGPWKTLQYAAYSTGGGDTVTVHAGDYRNEDTGWGGLGFIGLTNSGSKNNPIRFVAAAGESPLVTRFRVHSVAWLEIVGFTFTNPDFVLPVHWTNMPRTVVDDPKVEIDFDTDYADREADVRAKFATYMAIQDHFDTTYSNSIDVEDSHHITTVSYTHLTLPTICSV